jgi:hypothetical protein
MGRDITELKYAENELRETRRELAKVAGRAMLAAMTAAMAHEIKICNLTELPGSFPESRKSLLIREGCDGDAHRRSLSPV